MAVEAPSNFNQHIFFDANSVFYGTDDGYQDGSLGELGAMQALYDGVEPWRRENIHFVSAIGGLYGLNLMTCWRPTEITFFDINPHATAYFELVRRVFALSADREDFLARLTDQNYEVESEEEVTIRENLAMKQRNELPRSRGSAYRRSLAVSWQYALDHFDETKRLLTEVPLRVLTEAMEGPLLADLLRNGENVWMYCSNIVEFTYSNLRFDHPANAVVLSIVYPGQVDLLDLAPFGDVPVEVHCEIPMRASRVEAHLVHEEPPTLEADDVATTVAALCVDRLGMERDSRVLDIGCGWGRIAIPLMDQLGPDAAYEGFDPTREHVQWAQSNLMPRHPGFGFHIANLRNHVYKPDGTLLPTRFRFPYSDAHFDVVIAHSLFRYLEAGDMEHYVAEVARVLKPGGRLLATFHLLDDESVARLPDLGEPLRFAFPSDDGNVTTTEPRCGGLAAHQTEYVQAVITKCGLETQETLPGTWRNGATTGLVEDAVIATKPAS